jgi:uncharacterized protein (DUF4213/DUF364 family)
MQPNKEAGTLIGQDVKMIIPWAKEIDILKSSIGVAAINAVMHNDAIKYKQGNIVQNLDIRPTDVFGMVGYFHPIVDSVKKTADKFYIFERVSSETEDIFPDWAMDMYLPKCDVAFITATSVINKTIDHILYLCKNARSVYITGPSTPMCPQAFDGYNVSCLAGSVVINPYKALEIVSQGGGTMNLKTNAIKPVLAMLQKKKYNISIINI